MPEHDTLEDLLQKTSRTFALTIPLLPEPMRREVGVGYLLFRIIDCFEDATFWAPEQRIRALTEFVHCMEDADPQPVIDAAARWFCDPPLAHEGYLELIRSAPLVLEWHRGLAPTVREKIREQLARTALGMADFVHRTSGEGTLRLETLLELREYCYVVAGIVGELLTEIYLQSQPQLATVAAELRARATHFGEGLQLVNILKDVQPDAAEGRVYLPPDLALEDAFALARADLARAFEYIEILRSAGADFGVVAFNALNARLALATLRVLQDQGPGSKLTRSELTGLANEVMHSIRSGAPLAPEL